MKYICSNRDICPDGCCYGKSPHYLKGVWDDISKDRPYKCSAVGFIPIYPIVFIDQYELPKDLFEI